MTLKRLLLTGSEIERLGWFIFMMRRWVILGKKMYLKYLFLSNDLDNSAPNKDLLYWNSEQSKI